MAVNARYGAVIFAANLERMADFYTAVTGLAVELADETVVVLGSGRFELVIHKLAGEPVPGGPPMAREDTYIKPFFPVASLAAARAAAATFGGRLQPADKEWSGRGFRACEAVDPEGNVIQFREEQ
jgi:predicted enzyme related to lactoylglutathione lyase